MTARTIMKLSLQEKLAADAAQTARRSAVVSELRTNSAAPSTQSKKRDFSQISGGEDSALPQKQRLMVTLKVRVPPSMLQTPTTPRYGRAVPGDSNEADGDGNIVVSRPRVLPKPRNRRIVPDSSDDEDGDNNTVVSRPRLLPRPRNRRVVPDDSDDEDGAAAPLLSRQATPTKRRDSVLDCTDSDATDGEADPESEGEPLTKAEVTITAYVGPEGRRKPVALTARLAVHTDPDTSCRLEYYTTFHLEDATKDCGTVEVAQVHAWRILKQKDWQGELLKLKLKGLDTEDARFECARLIQTLFKTPSKLMKGASNHLDLLNPQADIMHVGVVYVYNDFQRQGLLSPVLESLRRVFTHPALTSEYRHTGPILLCPGKFNDAKAKCWNDASDQTVTEALAEIYRKSDGYQMVLKDGVLPKLNYLTTILGRMAEDK
ncbi:hypothetical protein Slin15195_G114660 [Septoria linicola]|uniref:Uncharacterized protein n=1 Tax=Septoria linicola TaxID=215465 RepID=A0A9Q9AY64_9PEZI|nr:hypothetical protein Slin14017_G122640 [Septoria linicola]USW58147.1 hypothetical protein Slin15195_G114660 [Septoria linicola]